METVVKRIYDKVLNGAYARSAAEEEEEELVISPIAFSFRPIKLGAFIKAPRNESWVRLFFRESASAAEASCLRLRAGACGHLVWHAAQGSAVNYRHQPEGLPRWRPDLNQLATTEPEVVHNVYY